MANEKKVEAGASRGKPPGGVRKPLLNEGLRAYLRFLALLAAVLAWFEAEGHLGEVCVQDGLLIPVHNPAILSL